MTMYYNLDGDICINFNDPFADPDLILKVEEDVVKIIAGDEETEIALGAYVDVQEVGDKLIIDFDPSTPAVDGFEMEMGTESNVSSVVVKEAGETVMEVSEDGVKNKEDIADEEAVAEGNTCKVGDQYFATLKEAVLTAQPGEALSIKMIADENGPGIGLFKADGQENLDITIDFDGHEYVASSPAVGSASTQTQALHLEMNNKVTLKNGSFTSDRNAADIKMLIQNYCDLTLDHMVCDCADDPSITYVVSNNFGNCLIKNSELHAHPSRVALDCWFGLGATYYSGLTVTAENSILDSVIEYGAQKASISKEGNETWWEKAALTLNGCTFGRVVNSGNVVDNNHNITIDGNKYEGNLPIEVEG